MKIYILELYEQHNIWDTDMRVHLSATTDYDSLPEMMNDLIKGRTIKVLDYNKYDNVINISMEETTEDTEAYLDFVITTVKGEKL